MSAPTNNDTSSYPYNPWDSHNEIELTDSTRAINILAAVLAYPSIFIYLSIIYAFFRKPTLRRHSGYVLLIVQNTYDLLYLIVTVPKTTVEVTSNTLLPDFTGPTPISCFLGDLTSLLRFEHLLAHVMVTGNRFVAIVFYSQYKIWFTRRHTAIYAGTFCLLSILLQIIVSQVMDMRACLLNLGGLAILAPSSETYDIAGMFVSVISVISIFVVVILNTIAIFRLKKLTKVNPSSPPLPSQTLSGAGGVEMGVMRLEARSNTINVVQVQPIMQPTSTVPSNIQAPAKLGKREVRLTIHFLVVTSVFIVTWMMGAISFFMKNFILSQIILFLNVFNYVVNAYSIIILSADIRKQVFSFNTFC